MTRIRIISVIVGVILLTIIGVFVKTNFLDSKPTLFTVVGEGKIKTNPEIAQFSISYITYGASATEALEGEKVFRERVVTLLSGLYGVEQTDLQVSYPKVASSNSTGNSSYQAVNSIYVKFYKLASLDTAINKLYQTGGTSISITDIIFTTSNSRNLEDRAISEAIKDGKRRAEKIANEAGKKLGKLISVTGQQTQEVGTVTTEAKRSAGTGETASETSPGQIEITRNVSLVYELK